MKKPKLLFKVDHNKRGKVYINHKWLRDVIEVSIDGNLWGYSVIVERYKKDATGCFIVENNEIKRYTTEYYIGGVVKNDRKRID